MRITNNQKQQLSAVFKRNDLNLIDFNVFGEYEFFELKYKHDYFSFSIQKLKDDIYKLIIFDIDRKNQYNYSANWVDTVSKFNDWTNRISKEIKSNTGWESFENTIFLNENFNELSLNFSKTEKDQVRNNLNVLKDRIKFLELGQENNRIILNKLDSLSEKVDELNKFDWKSLFIGTIASLIMTLVIPQEASGLIWQYIKSTFDNLKIQS